MSVELIALMISTLTMLLGFVGVIGWLINRNDRQLEKFSEQISARLDGVERELVEVKVAVARIEGPPRHLVFR